MTTKIKFRNHDRKMEVAEHAGFIDGSHNTLAWVDLTDRSITRTSAPCYSLTHVPTGYALLIRKGQGCKTHVCRVGGQLAEQIGKRGLWDLLRSRSSRRLRKELPDDLRRWLRKCFDDVVLFEDFETDSVFRDLCATSPVIAAVARDDSTGICRACGNEQTGCEPDARNYKCEACGAHEVYGAEELLMMGEE